MSVFIFTLSFTTVLYRISVQNQISYVLSISPTNQKTNDGPPPPNHHPFNPVISLFVNLCDASHVSFTQSVLTFGDAQGDDEENSLPHMDHGFHSKLPPGILPHGLPTVKEVAPAITPQEKNAKEAADERKEGAYQI